MIGSNSSIHGDRHGEEEPPAAQAELCQIADSLLQAMKRMLDARIQILKHDMTVLEMVVVVAGRLVIMAKMEDGLRAWSWPSCSF